MLVITNCKHDFQNVSVKYPSVLAPLGSLWVGNGREKHVPLWYEMHSPKGRVCRTSLTLKFPSNAIKEDSSQAGKATLGFPPPSFDYFKQFLKDWFCSKFFRVTLKNNSIIYFKSLILGEERLCH